MPVISVPDNFLTCGNPVPESTCSTLEGKNSHKPMTAVVSLAITCKYIVNKYTLSMQGEKAYLLMLSITSKHPPVARHTWMLVCLDNVLVTE